MDNAHTRLPGNAPNTQRPCNLLTYPRFLVEHVVPENISRSCYRDIRVSAVLRNGNTDRSLDAIHVHITHEGDEEAYRTYFYRSELLRLLKLLDEKESTR